MKSIVTSMMCKVLYKIENISLSKRTKPHPNHKRHSKYSDSSSIPSIRSDCDDKIKDEELIKLSYIDLNDGDTSTAANHSRRIYRKCLVKSKSDNTSKTPVETYGVHLPADHKDYLKHKRIYDSIAK